MSNACTFLPYCVRLCRADSGVASCSGFLCGEVIALVYPSGLYVGGRIAGRRFVSRFVLQTGFALQRRVDGKNSFLQRE